MKVTMIALKATRHRGRKLRAGDHFDVEPRTARVFGALGRARLAAEADLNAGQPTDASRLVADPGLTTQGNAIAQQPSQSATDATTEEPDALTALRAEFEGITGQASDRRWGEARLRTEIRDRKAAVIVAADDVPDGSPANRGALL